MIADTHAAQFNPPHIAERRKEQALHWGMGIRSIVLSDWLIWWFSEPFAQFSLTRQIQEPCFFSFLFYL
jgi:hypothetical protein